MAKYTEWQDDDKKALLEGWARDGLTDEQIAKNMGISRSTLGEWKKKYSFISDILKKGKEVSDYEVSNSLHKNATGYYYYEDVAFKCKETYYDEKGRKCEKEEIKTARIEKYRFPDTTAEIYWLNNRRPDKWKNKPSSDIPIDLEAAASVPTFGEQLLVTFEKKKLNEEASR